MTNARVLAGRLADLLSREHGAMADFLVALADFDRRRGWEELGYSSLFYFLHRDLGLSKGAAHYRQTAAKLVQRFPEIVEPLRDGRLCITSIIPLAKVLTPENRKETLPRFFQRSKREAMAVAAAIQPATAAPHRDVVTTVRTASAGYEVSAPPPSAAAAPPTASAPPLVQPVELNAPAPSLHPKPARRDAAEPLTAELSRLHITVSRRFLEKLEAARAALSHSHPLATAEDILETGLDLVLDRHLKRKGLGQKARQQTPPRQPPPETAPRQQAAPQETPPQTAPQQLPSSPAGSHIQAAVRRQVWIRDGGHCQWPLESGGICGSTRCVEFDHRIPRALGGPSTVDNIRLLCRFHNDVAARSAFGDEFMNPFTRGSAYDGPSQPGTGDPPG
jgi:5-methylcytosine-specific restriction endonuclease McrA